LVIKLQAGEFYGATSGTVAQAGFRFTEKTYQPQSNLPRHAHELAHFCFVLGGNYTETLRRRTEERTPAELIFYPQDLASDT
jgi:quercetin dioxygenase-like cupin family protein